MTTATTKKDPARVVTGKVRLSYLHVFTPRKADDSDRETYQACALIPKTDTVTIGKIKAAIEHVKNDPASAAVWGSKFLSSFKTPLRDGDTERDTEQQPEYKGCYFININSARRPNVVDVNVQPIIDANEVYSGCYGRVGFRLYAFKQKGGVGIAAGLDNIQKLEDGERLGGGVSAEDDFGPATEEEAGVLG